jgi:hypothetical protein
LAPKRDGERSHGAAAVSKEEIEQLARRVKMLDDRLDKLDSIVTTLVERVMRAPLTLELTCPKCSQQIEINLTSNTRLRGGI